VLQPRNFDRPTRGQTPGLLRAIPILNLRFETPRESQILKSQIPNLKSPIGIVGRIALSCRKEEDLPAAAQAVAPGKFRFPT
jgi:hypothetical protein